MPIDVNCSCARRSWARASTPATFAAQPLAVEQASPGELGTKLGAAQSLDRLAIGALGVLAFAEQRPRACEDASTPIGLADPCRVDESFQRPRKPRRPARRDGYTPAQWRAGVRFNVAHLRVTILSATRARTLDPELITQTLVKLNGRWLFARGWPTVQC